LNKQLIRKSHRWLGLVIGIQLLAWTVSGLYFTLIPIAEIRGSHLLTPQATLKVGHVAVISPNDLVRQHPGLADLRFDEIGLRQRGDRIAYLITNDAGQKAYDAESGALLAPLTESEAKTIAESRSTLAVETLARIESVEPGDEYRGGELPAWRVSLADNVKLYIGATSGQVRAVRTNEWRVFDFLWGLHIMDYEAREDFNHLLLQVISVLGVITVISGLILFFTTVKPLRRFNGSNAEKAEKAEKVE
jgi:hypothetical protein